MEKIWIKNYPKGIPAEVAFSKKTLADLFLDACKNYPNNKSLSCHDVTLTFAEVEKYVYRIHAEFVRCGMKKGDKVAVIMPNCLQYALVIFAVYLFGGIVVNINPLYTPDEIEYNLSNSQTKHVVILDMMASRLNTIYDKLQLKQVFVTGIADLYPVLKKCLVNFVLKKIKHMDTSYDYQAIKFNDFIHKKISANLPITPINQDDIAFIQYTGATTGRPKGTILTHKNLISNIEQVESWVKVMLTDKGSTDKQIVITALPLYHIFSLTANLLVFFGWGSENILIPNPRDIKSLVKTMIESKFTVFNSLDTLYAHLLNNPTFIANKYPDFKFSIAGGMPIRNTIAKKFYEVTGVVPSNCYGLTEASPAVTLNYLNLTAFDPSVGYPIPSTELDIRDIKTRVSLPMGEIGIIWIKGPQVTSGYYQDDVSTKEAFDENGWFNTKDIGYVNEKGQVILDGRQGDMIIVSGFNVYPAEIETKLDEISAIKEAAVIGVPNDDTGEKIVAFIVFQPDHKMSEDEIINQCREKLASYKLPRQIIFVSELPKTLVGKIDKKVLMQQFIKKVEK